MTNLKIQGDKLKKKVEENSLSMKEISKYILGKSDNFLTESLRKNTMAKGSLELLCDFLKVDINDYTNKGNDTSSQDVPSDLEFLDMNLFSFKKIYEKNTDEKILPSLAQMYNKENQIVSEIKVLETQNQQLSTTLKTLLEVEKQLLAIIKDMNSNINTNTDKVKAIFTEIKYNK